MNIKILDCTLRDGGYINDWEFSNQQINNIINSLEKSNIDIIECGYLDSRKGKASNSTLFDCTDSIEQFLKNHDNQSEKVVMINLGDFNIDLLPFKSKTTIDGIRLAFHKKDADIAFKISKKIIKLGYKLYFQPMVTKNYQDIEFLSLIKKANELSVY